MFEINETWLLLLHAVVAAPEAWVAPARLAERLGLDIETTTDRLAEMDEAGWIAVWERPDGLFVTLTALAAARMGVRIVEFGPDGRTRWADAGDPEPPPPPARNVAHGHRAADLEFVPDDTPSPDVAAELAERAEIAARAAASDPGAAPAEPPRPTLLIGVGLTPWPGPEFDPQPACPSCGGPRKPLPPHAYCLCCDRWGREPRKARPDAPAEGPRRRRRPQSPHEPWRDPKRQQIERRRRKSKRASRLAAKFGHRRAKPAGAA